jgi:hypothetical protein
MSTCTIVMKLANNLMILLQSFPFVCPFPSCEFRHLFFQKKSPAYRYIFHIHFRSINLVLGVWSAQQSQSQKRSKELQTAERGGKSNTSCSHSKHRKLEISTLLSVSWLSLSGITVGQCTRVSLHTINHSTDFAGIRYGRSPSKSVDNFNFHPY